MENLRRELVTHTRTHRHEGIAKGSKKEDVNEIIIAELPER